jgi:hypothetical protein
MRPASIFEKSRMSLMMVSSARFARELQVQANDLAHRVGRLA